MLHFKYPSVNTSSYGLILCSSLILMKIPCVLLSELTQMPLGETHDHPRCLMVLHYVRTDIKSIQVLSKHKQKILVDLDKLQRYKNGSYSITNINIFLRVFWKTKEKQKRTCKMSAISPVNLIGWWGGGESASSGSWWASLSASHLGALNGSRAPTISQMLRGLSGAPAVLSEAVTMDASVPFSVQRRGRRWAVVESSCAPGLLSLGLTFGFVQSGAVPADLGHAPHSLDTVHQL